MKSVLITGPEGCGKTLHAEALRQHFGCVGIVDDWAPKDGIVEGSLLLTRMKPGGPPLPYTSDAMDAYEFNHAMRLLNDAIDRSLKS